jgi:hypothetical protein
MVTLTAEEFAGYLMKPVEIVGKLLTIVKANEWQYRNAAENRYCPYCATDDEQWCDQREHHEGCQFVAIVTEAEQWLKNN